MFGVATSASGPANLQGLCLNTTFELLHPGKRSNKSAGFVPGMPSRQTEVRHKITKRQAYPDEVCDLMVMIC